MDHRKETGESPVFFSDVFSPWEVRNRLSVGLKPRSEREQTPIRKTRAASNVYVHHVCKKEERTGKTHEHSGDEGE